MTSPQLQVENASAQELLQWAFTRFGERFVVLTSLQKEGMAIVDMAVRLRPDVRVYTIDTGRLPAATYEAIEQVYRRYRVRVRTIHPDAAELAGMVSKFGPNLFLESPAHRRACCELRKVRPLQRALRSEGIQAYAVGLRRGQGESRQGIGRIDESGDAVKISPLADWTSDQVAEYLREHDVPVHPLYAKGYTSIGCDPCTRPVSPGEDERAGRWWWEQGVPSECGLHFSAGGKVERSVDVLLREILSF
jgi:phosphoadenylyl-sulfate reductase (thioredoxin)